MSLQSRLIARLYRLPAAQTRGVVVERALASVMADGVVLRADRYYPRDTPDQPTMLIRTPYGRGRLGPVWGPLYAERGFQVIVQSCRGTDDSGGELSPFRGEREDGLATLEWLKAQRWFDGRLVMAGPSYMGFTQWALARDAGPMLKAFSTAATSSEFRSAMYPGGSFSLEVFLQWMQIVDSLRGSMLRHLGTALRAGRRLKAATLRLPLREADEALVGEPMRFWRDWLEHDRPGDGWWAGDDFSASIGAITAPNHLISGWYDFLLPQLLRDYLALERAGRRPYLTVGPWSHSSNGLAEAGVRESLLWLRAHVHGEAESLRAAPVRIHVMGADEWRDLAAWPPAEVQAQRWHLQTGSALAADPPADAPPSEFRFDPADPTPSVGGATNAILGRGTGARDNRALEARPDVLVFTSALLERDIEVIGPVFAELFVESSAVSTDFFVRLCDVHPDGRSMNVCDGISRVMLEAPGVRAVTIELWPTAHRFRRGHRMRVQVSSGAFPRFARNPGTGESLASATSLRAADQRVHHDRARPSAIVLPVMPPADR